MEWNANGLLRYQQELRSVLGIEKIDVCLISETLTKQSYIKFRGYKVYHAIHPANTARSRSAIIIEDNTLHQEGQDLGTNKIPKLIREKRKLRRKWHQIRVLQEKT
ncbi:RTJK polymerase, partial [Acromyrmex heyeri]